LSTCNDIFSGTQGNPSLDTLMSMLSGLGSGGGLGVPNNSNGEYTITEKLVCLYINDCFLVL